MHGAVNTLESLTRLRSVNHSAGFTRLQCKRSCSSVRPFRHSTVSQLQAVSSTWDVVTTNTLALSAREIPMLSGVLDKGEQHALLLSTLAGLSTSIGGAIAIVKKPGNDLLSFLLGIAIGVMATLSVLEMWLHNALEHGPIAITAATAAGIALYYIAQPYFPDFDTHQAMPNIQNASDDYCPSARHNLSCCAGDTTHRQFRKVCTSCRPAARYTIQTTIYRTCTFCILSSQSTSNLAT